MKYPNYLKKIWSDGGIMLTYSFENRADEPLYEHLYKQIKNDINTHKLVPHEKLPSKRALAKHLNISTITVENAYNQLAIEGYIYSIPRSGFYVSDIPKTDVTTLADTFEKGLKKEPGIETEVPDKHKSRSRFLVDFVNNSTPAENFPFSTWVKLMREVMSHKKKELMTKSPSTGVYQLRRAIANYLYEFRGMLVDPAQVVVGAGTEYLYGTIIQLLGRDKKYAVEDPGYQKISRIYKANNVECIHIPLDNNGINIDALEKSDANVLHITPSHHFPTGLVTPVSRRHELLSWASKSADRFIIEDDYDSEFRLQGKPVPALQSIDTSEKVIYINTFSKSLTSTIRISYMVLPKTLIEKYNKELNFYSCTVSNFEQYTLASFIEQGYFEKHINRMRNYYRNLRDRILDSITAIADGKNFQIMEEDAGLHFLVKLDTGLTDEELVEYAAQKGINISCLSQYYHDPKRAVGHTLVINYSGINEESIEQLLKLFGS